jgi:opacity protein-like surface antigen
MARIATLLVAAVAGLAFAAAARAADVPGAWPPDVERPSPKYRELRSGWYLRGDVGYRFNRIGHVDASNGVTSRTFDNAVSAGGGFGYKERWFRTDLTVDYGAPAKFNGTTQSSSAQPQYTTSIDATTMLINGYLDLGTWAGLTPYVGAGIGASLLRTYDYRNSALPAGELVPLQPKWNLAWAATAGVSYRVLPSWAIDVGYRYLSLGTALSGPQSTGSPTAFRNLSAQEVRVGFRFLID